jgi:hypothetical protein
MPRWEKIDPKSDQFFEAKLEGVYVWLCEGNRKNGTKEWSINHNNPRQRKAATEAEAQVLFDKLVGALSKRFVKTNEETPDLKPFRKSLMDQRAGRLAALRAWEEKHGFMKVLQSAGTVRWVGQIPSNKNEFWEISLTGTTMTIQTGKIGKGKPKVTKKVHETVEAALSEAQGEMMSSFNNFKFGPEGA